MMVTTGGRSGNVDESASGALYKSESVSIHYEAGIGRPNLLGVNVKAPFFVHDRVHAKLHDHQTRILALQVIVGMTLFLGHPHPSHPLLQVR